MPVSAALLVAQESMITATISFSSGKQKSKNVVIIFMFPEISLVSRIVGQAVDTDSSAVD